VRPVNAATEKGLLYRDWVERNRAYVERASGGRLGYVHMFDMSEASLSQLYVDLDAQNQARDGVVDIVWTTAVAIANPPGKRQCTGHARRDRWPVGRSGRTTARSVPAPRHGMP